MTISSTTNTVSYTGNGSTTEFAVNYVFFGTGTSAEIEVVEVVIATGAESVKSNGSDFTVSGGNGATGTVTAAVAPASTVKWVINRTTTQTQETDYVENDPFPAESHEEALDRLTAVNQEQQRALGRTAQLPDGYTGSFDPTLPTTITANTALVINESADGFIVGPTAAEISSAQTYATNALNSATASASSAAAAATSYDNFDDRYLGQKSSDPSTDNDGDALLTGALYFNTSNNVMMVYTGSAWVRTTPTSGDQTNINAVAANATNINTVAGVSANVTTVANISSNVTTVAGISANTTTVAGISSDVTTTAGIASDVTTVAADSTDIATVAGISADVTTVAANVTDVTNFADVYIGPSASDPTQRADTSALQAGDLYFNTTSNELKVYNGSAWQVAAISAAGLLVAANNLSDVASAATSRTNLGVAIGTDVQAFDADNAVTDAAQTFTVSQRGTITTDNDLSFDIGDTGTNNFKCTPSGAGALTFTNHTAGQSGNILLINSGGHAISLAATTKGDANLATTISTAGTYWLSYYDDGTNAYVVTSAVFA